jgi:hypothetical protein
VNVTLHKLFAVPAIEYVWPDSEQLNAELAKVAMHEKNEDRGGVVSNVGGFHSFRDLHKLRPDPCISELAGRFTAQAQKFDVGDFAVAELWANVNGPGDHNGSHDHMVDGTRAVVSGFYIVAGDSGRTVFHHRVADKTLAVHPFDPQPGLMVLFPSWAWHSVESYQGEGFRISYSLNLVRV